MTKHARVGAPSLILPRSVSASASAPRLLGPPSACAAAGALHLLLNAAGFPNPTAVRNDDDGAGAMARARDVTPPLPPRRPV